MNNHSLSIIIPAIDEYQNLSRLIPFIKDNTSGHEVEIIVADGGSNDATPSLCNGRDIRFISCPKKSRAAQMNHAVAIASHPLLYFLHADTLPPSNFYEGICSAMAEGKTVGCFKYKFDKPSLLLKINSYFTKFDGPLTGGGDQSLFIPKLTFIHLGGYDESHTIMEDFEFVKRIKRQGIKFTVIQEPMTVSARKYEKNSYLRVNLINLYIMANYRMGADINKLKSFYNRHLNR